MKRSFFVVVLSLAGPVFGQVPVAPEGAPTGVILAQADDAATSQRYESPVYSVAVYLDVAKAAEGAMRNAVRKLESAGYTILASDFVPVHGPVRAGMGHYVAQGLVGYKVQIDNVAPAGAAGVRHYESPVYGVAEYLDAVKAADEVERNVAHKLESAGYVVIASVTVPVLGPVHPGVSSRTVRGVAGYKVRIDYVAPARG